MNARCIFFLLCGASALAACADLREGSLEIKRSVYAHRDTVKELVKPYPPPPKPGLKPVRDAYCYRVMQDIMCYHEPQPGAEARLVAYQGNEIGGEGVANSGALPQMAAAVQPVAVRDTAPRQSSIHVPLLLTPQEPPPPAATPEVKPQAKLEEMGPPVFVGEGPPIKEDATPTPQEPVR
jgi:hypothetical protein